MSQARGTRVRRSIDDERRDAASELLRHLNHPARLRTNRLALLHLGTGAPDEAGLLTIRRIISQALAQMAAMERAIIERCDIGGEIHRSVARDLAITERHFYRVRHTALAAVVHALERPQPLVEHVAESEPRSRIALAVATALDQAGKRDAAIETLRRAATDCDDLDDRLRLETVLAQRSAEAGLGEAALARLARVEHELVHEDAQTNALRARITVAKASVQAVVQDVRSSIELLPRALVALRSAAMISPSLGVVEAYAGGLLLQAEYHRDVGSVDDAIAASQRAVEVLALHVDASTLLRADASQQLALIQLLANRATANVDQLRQVSEFAMRSGLVEKSLMIAVDTAAIHRVNGDARRAAAMIVPLVPMIRQVCTGRDLWVALLDLAASHAEAGNVAAARELVIEAVDAPGLDPSTAAMARYRLADLEVRHGRPRDAVEPARAAREMFARLGNPRLAGAAMRIEAEAEHLRGDRKAATARIVAALDLLRGSEYPAALARATATFTRITGSEPPGRSLAGA